MEIVLSVLSSLAGCTFTMYRNANCQCAIDTRGGQHVAHKTAEMKASVAPDMPHHVPGCSTYGFMIYHYMNKFMVWRVLLHDIEAWWHPWY